jgi:Zn-dependent protease
MRNLKITSSLLLGEIYKIKLYVHWTFLLLIGWVLFIKFDDGFNLEQAILRVVFIVALFSCVIAHELGHALTARKFGFQTKNIILLPIGGVAQIEKMPEEPWQELIVAIAGPLVSFAIAILLYTIVNITGEFPSPIQMENISMDNFIGNHFLLYLSLINFMLAIFNLIPAFPMDGGRILRALLSMGLGRLKATEVSSVIGQFLSIIFIIFAIQSHNPWLAIIGAFIFLAAKGEAVHEDVKSLLSKYRVRDLTMSKYTTLNSDDSVDKAVAIILNGQERDFIVAKGQETVGILTRDDIIKALSQKNNSPLVHQVMNKNFLKLDPNMNLAEAYEQMLVKRFAVAAIVEDGKLIGILDTENIQESLLFQKALKK